MRPVTGDAMGGVRKGNFLNPGIGVARETFGKRVYGMRAIHATYLEV